MPMLQISASFATKGTMPRDTALVTSVTTEKLERLIPEVPAGGAGWAHWNEAEELICSLLGRKLFFDQSGPIENVKDMRRLGVWFLKATLKDDKGSTNSLTLINDKHLEPDGS